MQNLGKRLLRSEVSQCGDCIHWQTRGGIVLERTWKCTALEGESERMAAIVTAMAQLLAKSGQCPSFETLHQHVDGYVSLDLYD